MTARSRQGLPGIKGISQVPGHPPYPEIMTEALVDDARRRGAAYLLTAGDVGRVRAIFDGFGRRRDSRPFRPHRGHLKAKPLSNFIWYYQYVGIYVEGIYERGCVRRLNCR
jgi:hypothetical protein